MSSKKQLEENKKKSAKVAKAFEVPSSNAYNAPEHGFAECVPVGEPVEESVQTFLVEAVNSLEELRSGLFSLEQEKNKEQLIQEMVRSTQSMKERAGVLGLNKIQKVFHALEKVIGTILRSNRFLLDRFGFDLCSEGLEIISYLLDMELTGKKAAPMFDIQINNQVNRFAKRVENNQVDRFAKRVENILTSISSTEDPSFYTQGILPSESDIKPEVDSYKEVDELFKLADELHDQCSEQYRRIDRMYQIITFFIVTVIFLIILLVIDPKAIDFIKQTESTVAKVILLSNAYLMVFVFMAVRQIRKAKEKIKPEELTLSAILELIRETEGLIAYENNLSPLQRASCRIRLSKYSTRYS